MKIHTPHKPHRTHNDEADEPTPGLLPVEPDQGPVPDGIPADPEHEGAVDPEA